MLAVAAAPTGRVLARSQAPTPAAFGALRTALAETNLPELTSVLVRLPQFGPDAAAVGAAVRSRSGTTP